MINEGKENQYPSKGDKDIELRAILDSYLVHWQWFVLATVISLIIALLYLQLTTPIYKTVASIIVENEKKNGSSNEDAMVADLGLLSSAGTRSIENELGLLRSKRLLAKAVKRLGLNITYFDEQGLFEKELYTESPFIVELININVPVLKNLHEEGESFYTIKLAANGDFIVIDLETDESFSTGQGELLKMSFGDLFIRKNKNYDFSESPDSFPGIKIEVKPVSSVVYDYWSKIKVALIDENATLIELSLDDPLKQKAEDILNQVVLEYNREAIEDKNLIAENTSFFIDERLRIISSELDSVESGKEAFKESNSITNIDFGASLIMQNASEYSLKQQEVNSQLSLLESMLRYLDSDAYESLPSNIGIQDNGIDQLIEQYNGLIIERTKALAVSTLNHPKVVGLTSQIEELKKNLRESFKRLRSNLRISRNSLSRQAGIISSQISDVPGQERQFRDIQRQQNIKEALYLLLLEKREENSLALAATAPKAKIVDLAYTYDEPVSPNSKIILLGALLMGMVAPVFYISLKKLINNKIWNVDDIKSVLKNINIIGEVPHLNSENGVVKGNDRTVLSEAFRIVSSNIKYSDPYRNKIGNGAFCIFVTSTLKGEGKTFTSVNLAMTLANAGKRVLVIGADLRNPKLNGYIKNGQQKEGLSHFLANKHQNVDNYLKDSNLHSRLKLFIAGKVPPNPSELLQKDSVSIMFNELKQLFDYIIVDTAPAMLVADTFLITKNADLTLYVIRAGHTKKQLLDFVSESYDKEKLVKPAIILNDVKSNSIAYGYGYGYEDTVKDENVLEKMKRILVQVSSIIKNKLSALTKRKSIQ